MFFPLRDVKVRSELRRRNFATTNDATSIERSCIVEVNQVDG